MRTKLPGHSDSSLVGIKVGPKITNSASWPTQPVHFHLRSLYICRNSSTFFSKCDSSLPTLYHHGLSLSYIYYLVHLLKGGDLYGEVIYPILLEFSVVKCFESKKWDNSHLSWMTYHSANNGKPVCHLLVLYYAPGTVVTFIFHFLWISMTL